MIKRRELRQNTACSKSANTQREKSHDKSRYESGLATARSLRQVINPTVQFEEQISAFRSCFHSRIDCDDIRMRTRDYFDGRDRTTACRTGN
jgi:hypothetical protein